MSDSKPPSSKAAAHSLKSTHELKTSTSALPNQKPNLADLGTHSLLADWLNTEHRHERLAVRLALPLSNAKGESVETNEKAVDEEGKKGL